MANKLGMGTGKADATLVAAGYRLGQSYIPKDYSDIFRIQYEGLAAAHKAKTEATSKTFTTLAEEIREYGEFKKEEGEIIGDIETMIDDIRGDQEQLEESVTDYTTGKIKDISEHYESGGDFNIQHSKADENYLTGLKDEFESLNKKLITTKEDRARKKEIKKEIGNYRNSWNRSRGNLLASGKAWRDGHANTELSFKGDPELNMLYTNILDPDADLDNKNIDISWEKGKKYYSFDKGTLIASEAGAQTPEGPKERIKISEKDLLSMVKYKDRKTEASLQGIDGKVLDQVNSMIKNSKTLSVGEFSDIESTVKRDYKDSLLKSDNIQDLTTRDVLIGGKERNYKKDLSSNMSIDVAILDNIPSLKNKFTEQQLLDGKLTQEELNSSLDFKKAKAEIIEILTNPKTASQREISANAYAQYRTDIIKNTFNTERKRIQDDKERERNAIIEASRPQTINLPWAKNVQVPTTQQERDELTIINSLATNQKTIRIGTDIWELQPNGEYKNTGSTKSGGFEEYEDSAQITKSKQYLYRLSGNSRFSPPDNYFSKEQTQKDKKNVTDPKDDPVLRNILENEKRAKAKDLIDLYSK